jgi:hypothetical protein
LLGDNDQPLVGTALLIDWRLIKPDS